MSGKRKMSGFSKIYISVVSVFVVILIIAAFVLHSVLNAYEITRPRHVAKDVFERYFITLDFGGLMKYVTSEGELFESAERINEGVKDLYDPSTFEYFSVSTDENGNEKYAVTSENKRIAYFTVSKTDKKAKYGFSYYDITGDELFFASVGDVKIRVPEGYSLSVNGIAVGDSYIAQSNIEGESCKYMPEGVTGIMYTDYKISSLFFEPSITVTSPDGTNSEVKYNTADKLYEASVIYDSTLESDQSDYIIKAASAYTAYMSNDAQFGSVSGYLDKASDIYDRVRTVDNFWVRDHSGYTISGEKASEFYRYSDDIYSCRVTMKQTLKRAGYADHIENIDLILYLRKSGDKYLIYDIITNS